MNRLRSSALYALDYKTFLCRKTGPQGSCQPFWVLLSSGLLSLSLSLARSLVAQNGFNWVVMIQSGPGIALLGAGGLLPGLPARALDALQVAPDAADDLRPTQGPVPGRA